MLKRLHYCITKNITYKIRQVGRASYKGICPILRPVLHKIETLEKIKVTKLSKIKGSMCKLKMLFLVEAENACTIWWCGSL